MSECDHEPSIMRRPWPTRGFCAMVKKKPTIKSAVVVNELAFYSAQHPFPGRSDHDNRGNHALAGRGGLGDSLLIRGVLRITAATPLDPRIGNFVQ